MSQQLRLSGIVTPLVIGIGGCSGSGKTTLARELAEQLNAILFPLDFYYRDLAHLSAEERSAHNFDHPDSLEDDLIVAQLAALRNGQSIHRPIYDFSTHSRIADASDHIHPSDVIIVEGILALHYTALLPLYDYTVYVEAPHDVCLLRRIHRDTRERGRTEASVRQQFESHAKPMADRYVLPSRSAADLAVSGTEALDWSIETVLAALQAEGMLRERQGASSPEQ